jgi:tetratricopeptide (TPR) repeat protein
VDEIISLSGHSFKGLRGELTIPRGSTRATPVRQSRLKPEGLVVEYNRLLFRPKQVKTFPPMFKHLRLCIILLALNAAFQCAYAQGPSKPDARPDYSNEAYVVEQTSSRIVFENDGTGTRESSARIRIQSDAGVQRYGLLTFSYESSIESLDIDYVRVQKKDGSVVPTPAENTQDMAAEITRQAPFYSDLREKHVAVKGLSVGDTLEFQAHWRVTKPLAPGQFWYAYNFSHDGIILEEQLQINMPRDRPVKWKSPNVKPAVTEEGARQVYTWSSSQLDHKSSEQEKAEQETQLYQAARGQLPPADVQISSFQSWEDVGRWYGNLQQERVKATPEIQAKATELTKGASDDNAKLRAIYKYVSTEFRYIGIAFGIGRYQPHTAAEVLSNQYGDCKDKHTLLASLLDAASIKAYPALISSSHDVDVDVPSPAQFDHVISVVPQGSNFLWLDTTTEVAPFAYLVRPLRDKRALAIPEDKPPTLMTTPADPPSKAWQTFKIEAKLDDTGTLTGKVERTVQGDDSEVLIRTAFRRVPMPQWKDLIQQISYGSGFAGDVSEVTASSPENTDEPFHFTYNYKRKDYPDWTERRINSPLPPMIGVTPESKPSHPIFLGETGEFQYESRVELPKGYWPALPDKVDLKEDYAEYHASYSRKDGVVTTERRFVIKLRDVPASEYDAFKKFAKAVADDHEVYAAVNSGSPPENSLQSAMWKLPDSDDPDAMSAYKDAEEASRNNNILGAIDSFKQAVDADPHFTRAWMRLGQLYAITGQRELGLEALRAAHDGDPGQPVTYKALVSSLLSLDKYEDAISVLQEVVKANPEDADAFSSLGGALFELKRYSEAAVAVEAAVKLHPERAGFHSQLGSEYLHAGDDDKALAAFKKALELNPSPFMFNDIGYQLADANKKLPQALEYAGKAVQQEEEDSQKVKLSDLRQEDLDGTANLGADWDTLGWVYFRMGKLDQAEKYVNAAWVLSQDWETADHLGQIYEKQHKKDAAVHMYSLALHSVGLPNNRRPATDLILKTRERLEQLSPGASANTRSMYDTSDELSEMRTFSVSGVGPGAAKGEFFLILGPGSKVEDVKFVSGSERLKGADKAVRAIPFNFQFPDGAPTRLVRRGELACDKSGSCRFVLLDPADVPSLK